MDKETVVRMCNRLKDGSLSLDEVSILIREFCLERGKELNKINQFITFLINTPFTTNCVLTSLEYYKKKFNVIELKKDREILLIY